ncbi:hypothetical protein NO559_08345 [Dasania sp. GY-MA-18]|uniref:Uncharacterized protein n=1 Tax=Dasania phycosphaerae TaxID=2950436 RepID=A0A9J6RLZ2_9GAMM|nr:MULTISPECIES: hypothetical protein [Dasania]MCR8922777.1 hypothetical protein [Dasania sp. GY-MA-18]MCZ0865207.1 hypothetical protein [Dasania phycosphaerae]MCZ0868933.1 hypothetical protein [Dasania phycosphaerae]
MTNYQPTIIKRVLSVSVVALSIFGFIHINSVIPEFIASLDQFNEKLPIFTAAIINYHLFISGFIILTLIVSLFLANTHSSAGKYHKLAFYYSMLSPLILAAFLAIVIFAMYLPIFTIEA